MTAEPGPGEQGEPLPEHLGLLAAELCAALPIDDVPVRVLERGRAAWTWRTIDSELAELAAHEGAVLRAGPPEQLLTFAVGEVFIDVDRVGGEAGGTTLVVGQVTAPAEIVGFDVELGQSPPMIISTELDSSGGFRLSIPDGVPARLIVQLTDGHRIVSSWMS